MLSPPAAPPAAATACWPTSNNAPAFVLGRGNASGILGPQSEAFVLALLFGRVEPPFVAVPDPQSTTGANDRLDTAFPPLFRDGLPGYRRHIPKQYLAYVWRENKEAVFKALIFRIVP